MHPQAGVFEPGFLRKNKNPAFRWEGGAGDSIGAYGTMPEIEYWPSEP